MSDDHKNSSDDSGKLLYCSFCGKSQHEVRKLIAGPSVFICDECVELCNDIIREEVQESSSESEILLVVDFPKICLTPDFSCICQNSFLSFFIF